MDHRFIVMLGFAVACAACSEKHEEAATPADAAPTSAPALATTATNASGLTYLYDLMQRPDFSTAFAALSNADQLPPWASQGGVATPAQQVTINGHVQLLAIACKPHDCPTERILILYDENTHAMSGLFARRKATAANSQANNETTDDLIWLGAPDATSRNLLRQKLYSGE